MKTIKDWDRVLEEISSGEESDEYDTPNIVSLKKHGPKLMEMVSNVIEAKTLNPEILKAQQKARRNTDSEPVMENFKSIHQEVNQAIQKKEDSKESKTKNN